MPPPDTSSLDDLKSIARRAMLDRGLLPDFSAAACGQADAVAKAAMESGPAIRDLRALLWASIDNDDSRDLDQLTVAEPLAGGRVKLLVAIADVDATVQAGSAIDDHARANTTSVYTIAQIFPMLPVKLSTGLTSLGEGEERLSVVIEVTVGADGMLADCDIYRAVVRNRAKLAYNGVAAWLEGTAPAPPSLAAVPGLDEQIRIQDAVAQRLQQVRRESGALNLEVIEAGAVFTDGVLSDLLPDEKNRAKELIENFMIAANGVTAQYLDKSGFPSIRRVLRAPERWQRIVALAVELHETLPPTPSAVALTAFLAKRRQADPTRFPDLSLSIVKLLGSGEYVLNLPGRRTEGHFGLAVHEYSHSTAPNRRFPDLITQRLLKAALSRRSPPYSDAELAALAEHCTKQEGNAAKVERQVRKSAGAMLLAARIGQRFDGIVTGASDKGTWVRILAPAVEGRVVQGAGGLEVGQRVQVQLIHTDTARGFIDFARAR